MNTDTASPTRWLMAPIAPLTWRSLSLLVMGWLLSIPVFVVAVVSIALSAGLVVLWIGWPMLAGSLKLCSYLAGVHRRLLVTYLGAPLPKPQFATPAGSINRRSAAIIRDGGRWREVAVDLAALPVYVVALVAVLGFGSAGLAALTAPLYASRSHGWFAAVPALLWTVVGILVIYGVALCAQGSSRLLAAIIAAITGDGSHEQIAHLRQTVQNLTETRTGAVEAADADRRRIERDLHDGAQQRLVALSVDLGMSRREAEQDPQAAVAALERAQAEVTASLRELRDLVRGVYPQVLTDRGLEAALSALTERSPVPITVTIVPPGSKLDQVPRAVAAASYFCVSECLANIARHSGASAGTVHIDASTPTLHLIIADNGSGTASLRSGGGLDGLRRRIEALDGTFTLTAVPNEGTRVEVTLPCES